MLRIRAALGAAALAGALVLALPGAVGAECDPVVGSWPSFGDVAPMAPTIVVGQVVELLDLSRAATSPGASPLDWKFRLRVDETLRGSSEQILTFADGIEAPGSQCLGPLTVAVADRLALALDTPSSDGPPTVLAVAYLQHAAPSGSEVPPGLQITEVELEALTRAPASPLPILVVGGLLLAVFVASTFAADHSFGST